MTSTSMNYRIAFLIPLAVNYKKSSWLGTYRFMAEALEKYCGNITYIKSKMCLALFAGKVINKISSRLFKKNFNYLHHPFIAKLYSKRIQKKLEKGNYDIVFAPAASTEVSFLKTNIPVIYWSDVTFNLMIDYYSGYSSMFKFSLENGHYIEKNAIHNSTITAYPSVWAANSAISDYEADKSKIRIVSYGGNLKKIPEKKRIFEKTNDEICNLLFLGVDWYRKGGDIAFEALIRLKEMNFKAKLIVCGCVPPENFKSKDMEVYPYLDKSKPEDCEKLNSLLLSSNFLFIPTRADCSPIVFSEASAFGLPIISTDTGGVSGIVRNNVNGYLLKYSERGAAYATVIAEVYGDKEKYNNLIVNARKMFDNELNWNAWGKSMRKIIEEIK